MIDLYDMQCNAFLPMQSIRSLLHHHSIYFLIINWIIKIGTTTTKYKYVYFKISKRQAPAGRGPGGMIERRREEERREEEESQYVIIPVPVPVPYRSQSVFYLLPFFFLPSSFGFFILYFFNNYCSSFVVEEMEFQKMVEV